MELSGRNNPNYKDERTLKKYYRKYGRTRLGKEHFMVLRDIEVDHYLSDNCLTDDEFINKCFYNAIKKNCFSDELTDI